MKSNTGRFITVVVICLGLMISLNVTLADAQAELSAEWWQWTLSIPTSVNPLTDTTGADCMVGQRGATWFLAGAFAGGTFTRTCSIPQGTMLFFPVINYVNINSPNVCGQDANNI